MNHTDTYSTRQAAHLAGVTRRQLQHWDECGLVVPRRAKGELEFNSAQRFYTEHHIERVRLVSALMRRGLRAKSIRRVLTQIDLKGSEATWLTVAGGRVRFWTYPADMIAYGARISGGMITVELPGV